MNTVTRIVFSLFACLSAAACADQTTGPPPQECEAALECEESCEQRKTLNSSVVSSHLCIAGFCACGFQESTGDCQVYVKPVGYEEAPCPVNDEALERRVEEVRARPEENAPATDGP